MRMSTYRIINKNDNKVVCKTLAAFVASYLLGRSLKDYIIIKSDETSDRIFNTLTCKSDVQVLQTELEKF